MPDYSIIQCDGRRNKNHPEISLHTSLANPFLVQPKENDRSVLTEQQQEQSGRKRKISGIAQEIQPVLTKQIPKYLRDSNAINKCFLDTVPVTSNVERIPPNNIPVLESVSETNILLEKLKYCGCDETVCSWFRSYFEHRMQVVECTDISGRTIKSTALPVNRGVVQGSVLGPTLYSVYTCDLLSCLKYGSAHMYADDTQLIMHTALDRSSILQAVEHLNRDITSIVEWSLKNDLVLNAQKCSYILLGTKHQVETVQSVSPNIVVGSQKITEISPNRNLGLLFDNSLKFEQHVNSKIGKCYYALNQIYKLRPFLTLEVRQRLVEALVLSNMDYGDIVYGSCLTKTTANKIQRVQNSCVRFCYTVPPRSHISPFLNTYNMLSMENRRLLKLYSFIFKLRKTSTPSYLASKLIWNDRSEDTTRSIRYPSLAISPRPRLLLYKGSFKYVTAKSWNALPPSIKKQQSLFTFKRCCKEWLLKTQKESCNWSMVVEHN
ncbi:reverse transcriptase (RNA-dependent DNA polymerase) domain-containing protein [Phthorimaea operculella]|nr:reverse transcriptase (RNA-dependent DNA polymerase) domain-containing protein [Phthorimaea operculella]